MKTLHLGLRVTDLHRSLAFYKGVGYEIVGRVAATPLGELVMLKLPDDDFVSLELAQDPARTGVDATAGPSHFVIQVESMNTTIIELRTRGIDAEAPTSPDDSDDFWTSWIVDPDGNRIELVQWPKGHPDGMTRADFAD
jgi:lactoylglutathione lyase